VPVVRATFRGTDLDRDAEPVAGKPREPEAMMCVPLEVAERTIAMFTVYRYGEDVGFSAYEALIVERFGIIVALALDSARRRELLRTQADTDELAGLLNRRAFNHRLDVLIHRARLTSTPLSLVELDIDEFKLINDRLRSFRGRRRPGRSRKRPDALGPRGRVRRPDRRRGVRHHPAGHRRGDEPDDRRSLPSQRNRGAVTGPPLTMSAGAASYLLHAITAEGLLRAADAALYAAKTAGRNRTTGAVDPAGC
jgi:GGDEF domain-containing protein